MDHSRKGNLLSEQTCTENENISVSTKVLTQHNTLDLFCATIFLVNRSPNKKLIISDTTVFINFIFLSTLTVIKTRGRENDN